MKTTGECKRKGVLREGEGCRYNDNCTFPECSFPMPILKFNNGLGALLCNKCRVIIKENLKKEEIKRPYLLFCKEHWIEYQNLTEEPDWVCFDCATKRKASIPEGHVYTMHQDTCGICNQIKMVTEPRDFGLTRGLLRIFKAQK